MLKTTLFTLKKIFRTFNNNCIIISTLLSFNTKTLETKVYYLFTISRYDKLMRIYIYIQDVPANPHVLKHTIPLIIHQSI